MKHKIVSAMFVVGFTLTGCGVDSIFEGGFKTWLVCFVITAICGYFLLKKGD